MEVVEADAPRLLVARWNGSTLRFALEADGDATWLRFTHAFTDPGQAALTAAGWDRCIVRLEAVLNGGTLDEPASLELWPWVHERYAERFGVDPEIGRRALAEHPAT
jgi:predicted acyl esterase